METTKVKLDEFQKGNSDILRSPGEVVDFLVQMILGDYEGGEDIGRDTRLSIIKYAVKQRVKNSIKLSESTFDLDEFLNLLQPQIFYAVPLDEIVQIVVAASNAQQTSEVSKNN